VADAAKTDLRALGLVLADVPREGAGVLHVVIPVERDGWWNRFPQNHHEYYGCEHLFFLHLSIDGSSVPWSFLTPQTLKASF
jgi:hypothetical protein